MAKSKAPVQTPAKDTASGAPIAASTISKAEAAALAGIKEKDVFAVNEYAGHYHVITVAGAKIVVEK